MSKTKFPSDHFSDSRGQGRLKRGAAGAVATIFTRGAMPPQLFQTFLECCGQFDWFNNHAAKFVIMPKINNSLKMGVLNCSLFTRENMKITGVVIQSTNHFVLEIN